MRITQPAILALLAALCLLLLAREAVQLTLWPGNMHVSPNALKQAHITKEELQTLQRATNQLQDEVRMLRELMRAPDSSDAYRAPRVQQHSFDTAKANANVADGEAARRLHFVFSADCRYPPKVHWQSIVLLYSFFWTQDSSSVITEVLSCHKHDWKPHWHDHWTPEQAKRVQYHVAPARNPHPVTKDEYAPYNKPSALLDWVQTSGPADDEIVVMVDWDNVLLRPFPKELLQLKDRAPQAAFYGIGTSWAYNEISNPRVCPWCAETTDEQREGAGAAGSPHAWTTRDFKEVLPLWLDYTDKIRQDEAAREKAGWMAEMYGYLIGALKLGFKHKLNQNWMLSSSHPAEWTDDLEPPLILHYCQTYRIGEWHYYKYDISAYDALSCDFSLLVPPPRDVGVGFEAEKANTGDIWLAHTMVMYTNAAFRWYKERACPNNHGWKTNKRWQAKPDSIGEYKDAPGNTLMLRGP